MLLKVRANRARQLSQALKPDMLRTVSGAQFRVSKYQRALKSTVARSSTMNRQVLPDRRAPVRRIPRSPTAPPLDGKGPLWHQIRRALANPIMSGAWPPGTRIPTETALTRSFRASRMTVGRAIQSLAGEGLVQRRRGIGTVVAESALERPVFEIWDIADIITRAGSSYQYRLIECRKLALEPERRELLGVSSRTPVLLVRCIHLCSGTPFQLEERLINADAAPGLTCRHFASQGPGRWLLGHVAWTDAEHKISAREASVEIAEQLQVRPQTACLVVDRCTWNHGAPVTHARLWHPGSSHHLVGHFRPSR
jgi:GntR family histidine utilization transcriptional repressor